MMKMHLQKFFLLDLVLFVIVHTVDGQTSCFDDERRGLLEFKSFVKSRGYDYSDHHDLLPSWVEDPESDCCLWERVRCNSITGRVIELSLNDLSRKSSTWNVTLFHPLKELRSLNLRGNKICGWTENQDSITRGKLEILDLSYNKFNGSIPRFIGKLSYLKALYLTGNRLNGSLPFPGLCELKRLEELDISHNYFEGTLPPCLNNLTSLRLLDLHDNLFTGSISPSTIPASKFLHYINFGDNLFEGSFLFFYLFNHSKLEVVRFGSTGNKLEIDLQDQSQNPLFQLKTLILSNCNLKNAPDFLLNQHQLRVVDLSHNNLNGKFPSWLLQNNTDLKFLILRNNSFAGQLHLPQHPLSSTIVIDVSDNNLDGQLRKDLGTIFSNLKHLNLSMNNFEGDIPPSIGVMRKLEMLDLSFNNFSGKVPEELGKYCTELRTLILSGNKLHGEIFSTHFNLSTNLVVLGLRDNQLTGSLTNVEFNFLSLFDISNNNMAGEIPSWTANVTVLAMRDNHFEGQLPCKQPFKASFIDLSYNSLSGSLSSCLWTEGIRQIHLQGNNFNGPIPYALINSSSLSVLNLRSNKLYGQLHSLNIGELPSLEILLLGDNRLSGLIPRHLCESPKIRIMDLSNNLFSGSIPSCLTNFTITTADCLYRGITEQVITHAGYRKGLYDFYQCFFVKHMISQEVGRNIFSSTVTFTTSLPVVEVEIDFVTKRSLLAYKGDILNYMSGLDLSCNNLTGEIPQSLGKLSSIRALNLSHNHLTWSIPVSFSNLTKVESLDLSYNNLSGKIPPELVNLNFLAVFSVAHNNLSGTIPDKGQFATFDNSSYEGNPFLIWPPLEENRTKVIGQTPSDDETKEKWYEIDHTFFFASFSATYLVFLLGFGTFIYINPYWRMRWFCFIEKFVYSTKLFLFYTC
ncbi:hypothetical protein PTKIN_Ptkin14bG0208300 [Pterospermum kingtungense]